MKIKGRYEFYLMNGIYVVQKQRGENLIVQSGLDNIAEIFKTNSGVPARPTHIAFGTNGTPAALGQTALLGEVLTRGAWLTVNRAANVVTFIAIYTNTSGTSPTIQEIGIFNAAAAGIMYSRMLPQKFVFDDTWALGFTWSLEFGS